MERNLTLNDLYRYTRETEKLLNDGNHPDSRKCKPGKRVLQNLLSYSRALEVYRTRTAGHAFLLMN